MSARTARHRAEPFRFANRVGVLRCRKCRKDVALTAGTVMQRTHTPLSIWFWGAYLVSPVLRQEYRRSNSNANLAIGRYETAFQILHKLRAGMVRADRNRIGRDPSNIRVEVEEFLGLAEPLRGINFMTKR